MYGNGTEASVESVCAHCGEAIRFSMRVTSDGAQSDAPAAAALREWDPLPTADDRKQPHMLDGM